MRATLRLCALWMVAIIVFVFSLLSVLHPHPLLVSGQNPSPQQSNSSIPASPTPPSHAIFRVDGVVITNTQWDTAVKSAFEARASSGQYLGGTQADDLVINTQAMHTVLDPLAEQEVIKELGLTTDMDTLYQQWLDQASPQEQQTAQVSQGNGQYKQHMAQEQKEIPMKKRTVLGGLVLLVLIIGISLGTILFLLSQPKWSFKTDDIISAAPTVANGIVYVGSQEGTLYALDAITGSKRWSFNRHTIIYTSPVVANGMVYVQSSLAYGYLDALDARSGQEKWSFQTIGIDSSGFAVANGLVYVGSEDGKLYALDALTGQEKWSFQTAKTSDYTSPVVSVSPVNNGLVYVGSADSKLYALDALTGSKKWSFQAEDGIFSTVTVIHNVYAGSKDGKVYALDALTGHEQWSFQTGGDIFSMLTVANGIVYAGAQNGQLYALDTLTGKEKWSFQTGNIISFSPAVMNGVVYTGSRTDKLYALDALTGKEKWSFQTRNVFSFSSPAANDVSDTITAMPVVANGMVYVCSYDTSIYAIQIPS